MEVSRRWRSNISSYMHFKWECDKNLVRRTAFKWTILRPTGLSDEPGTGTGDLGITHINHKISVGSLYTLGESLTHVETRETMSLQHLPSWRIDRKLPAWRSTLLVAASRSLLRSTRLSRRERPRSAGNNGMMYE
jgi:hypothetical protein